MPEDDKSVNDPAHNPDHASDALSPPPRRSGLRNNPVMIGVLALLAVAVVVFVVALAVR